MAEVTLSGFGASGGFGAGVGAEVTYGAAGKPVFDDSLEVISEGPVLALYDNQGRNVSFGATGKPVFDDSLEVMNEGPVLANYDNQGRNTTFGAIGTPQFDGSRELPGFIGPVLLNPDNLGRNVTLGGAGTPIFLDDNVVLTTPAIIPPQPTSAIVVLSFSKGTINPDDDVTYFTTPILGPTFPVTNDK